LNIGLIRPNKNGITVGIIGFYGEMILSGVDLDLDVRCKKGI